MSDLKNAASPVSTNAAAAPAAVVPTSAKGFVQAVVEDAPALAVLLFLVAFYAVAGNLRRFFESPEMFCLSAALFVGALLSAITSKRLTRPEKTRHVIICAALTVACLAGAALRLESIESTGTVTIVTDAAASGWLWMAQAVTWVVGFAYAISARMGWK